jgi:hypothetical protein
MQPKFCTLLVLTALSLACGEPVEPTAADPDIGIIDLYGQRDEVLLAPASARAGEDVSIVVRTFGNSCVSAARTSVTYRGSTVVVTPYDNSRIPGIYVCADILKRPEHTVTLRFERAGAARVRVEGRREPSGELTAVEATINIAAPL